MCSGEFYEVKCHEGPITRLRVSYDDFLLVSAGEDGSVVLMDIRDKELAKASTRQQQVGSKWQNDVWKLRCLQAGAGGIRSWPIRC